MMHKIIITFLVSISAINQYDCNDLPSHFKSYNEARQLIRNASFEYSDEVDTSRSSWIRSAEFLSCDGETGYFIFSTDAKEYIHTGMPISVWVQFKSAPSFGSFYQQNIRGRYILYVN